VIKALGVLARLKLPSKIQKTFFFANLQELFYTLERSSSSSSSCSCLALSLHLKILFVTKREGAAAQIRIALHSESRNKKVLSNPQRMPILEACLRSRQTMI
jgi:hypothetical protein